MKNQALFETISKNNFFCPEKIKKLFKNYFTYFFKNYFQKITL